MLTLAYVDLFQRFPCAHWVQKPPCLPYTIHRTTLLPPPHHPIPLPVRTGHYPSLPRVYAELCDRLSTYTDCQQARSLAVASSHIINQSNATIKLKKLFGLSFQNLGVGLPSIQTNLGNNEKNSLKQGFGLRLFLSVVLAFRSNPHHLFSSFHLFFPHKKAGLHTVLQFSAELSIFLSHSFCLVHESSFLFRNRGALHPQ